MLLTRWLKPDNRSSNTLVDVIDDSVIIKCDVMLDTLGAFSFRLLLSRISFTWIPLPNQTYFSTYFTIYLLRPAREELAARYQSEYIHLLIIIPLNLKQILLSWFGHFISVMSDF